MTQDTLYTGPEVRERLISGIKKVSEAVGSTMGPSGANCIIEAIESPGHYPTNDGYTIANSLRLADPIENMGKNILLEAINRANKQSGDGSSGTCVTTGVALIEGNQALSGMSPMELKRSMEACIPLIEESIRSQTREITVDEVGNIATISAEDPQIGQTIQEIYQQIGTEGIIHWDISRTTEDSYTIGSGITVEGAGFYSPYMCDADESGQNTNRIKLKNAHVLITKQKVASAGDFEQIALTLNNKAIKELVVFCDEVEPLVMPDLIKTRMMQGFRVILVRMPTLWKDQWYEDIALATGATIIDPSAGLSSKTTTLDHLGKVQNITITKDQTFLDGIKDLTNHIDSLKEVGDDDSLIRAARLNTKTARYFVGAGSDSALAYRRLKVEDAISAAYQALHGGIVVGGGIALVNAAKDLPSEILKKALRAPHEQIVKNMGSSFTEQDMIDQQVYDPAPVVLNAVKNAISVAASVLTASTLVLLPREEEVQRATPPVQI